MYFVVYPKNSELSIDFQIVVSGWKNIHMSRQNLKANKSNYLSLSSNRFLSYSDSCWTPFYSYNPAIAYTKLNSNDPIFLILEHSLNLEIASEKKAFFLYL